MMDAVLVSVGTELTTGFVKNTNVAWLSAELDGIGVRTVMGVTVPDSRVDISRAIQLSLELEPDIVVVTGGLGPTGDDMTSAAVAAALDLELELDPEAERMVARATASDPLKPHQEKQAIIPAGSIPIAPAGTAPGYMLLSRSIPFVVLPGVPWEMKRMWKTAMESPILKTAFSSAAPRIRRRMLFYASGEPRVSDAVDTAFSGIRHLLQVSICASFQEVALDVTCPLGNGEELDQALEGVRYELAQWYFSEGDPVEAVIGRLLSETGKTLAVGESCTGGLLGGAITSFPGSSRYFLGGVTAYANEVKHTLLRVRKEALDTVGAVSEPVAQQLALGARSATGADYGIGVTGIAGPEGGSEEKPVGLVFICASSGAGDAVEGFDFPGGREDVRRAAVIAALHMLRVKLIAETGDHGKG